VDGVRTISVVDNLTDAAIETEEMTKSELVNVLVKIGLDLEFIRTLGEALWEFPPKELGEGDIKRTVEGLTPDTSESGILFQDDNFEVAGDEFVSSSDASHTTTNNSNGVLLFDSLVFCNVLDLGFLLGRSGFGVQVFLWGSKVHFCLGFLVNGDISTIEIISVANIRVAHTGLSNNGSGFRIRNILTLFTFRMKTHNVTGSTAAIRHRSLHATGTTSKHAGTGGLGSSPTARLISVLAAVVDPKGRKGNNTKSNEDSSDDESTGDATSASFTDAVGASTIEVAHESVGALYLTKTEVLATASGKTFTMTLLPLNGHEVREKLRDTTIVFHLFPVGGTNGTSNRDRDGFDGRSVRANNRDGSSNSGICCRLMSICMSIAVGRMLVRKFSLGTLMYRFNSFRAVRIFRLCFL